MPYTPTQFYTGQPGTADTLLATVPGATSWLVKQITLTNTSASTATITLGLNSAAALAAANHFFSGLSLQPKEVVVVDLSQILATGQTIRALQTVATDVTVRVSGVAF